MGSAAVQLYYVSYLTMFVLGATVAVTAIVQMTATAWGQTGWFVAAAAIGVAIGQFKVHRKRPPH